MKSKTKSSIKDSVPYLRKKCNSDVIFQEKKK